MKIKSLLAALSIVGLSSVATAAPSLTYNVNRLIGIGSVVGPDQLKPCGDPAA